MYINQQLGSDDRETTTNYRKTSLKGQVNIMTGKGSLYTVDQAIALYAS